MMKLNMRDLAVLSTQIDDINAEYFGVDITDCMNLAGKGIAREITKKYGKSKSICFLCGKGNNGGNGFAAARHLLEIGYLGEITVYLCDRVGKLAGAASDHWEKLQKAAETSANFKIHSDVSAPQIQNHELICECLDNTSTTDKPTKKYRDIISRVTHFNQKIIAIDLPVPGYKWDLSISTMYPKTEDATVIGINMSTEITTQVGPGEVKSLIQSKSVNVLWLKTESNKLFAQQKFISSQKLNLNSVSLFDLTQRQLDAADCIVLDLNTESLGIIGAIEKIFSLRSDTPIIITTRTAEVLLNADLIDLHNCILIIDSNNNLTKQMFGQPNPAGNISRWCVSNQAHVIWVEALQDRIYGETLQEKPGMKFMHQKQLINFDDYEQLLALSLCSSISANHPWLSATSASFLSGIATFLDNDLFTAREKIENV